MRRVTFILMLLVLFGSLSCLPQDTQSASVPVGSIPELDGTLGEGEWDDALEVSLTAEVTVYLKHADGFLYLGVHAHPVAVISPCLLVGDEIRVMHISGSLGTATYRESGNAWASAGPFQWLCSYETLNAAARSCLARNLQNEAWTGPNGRMGTPDHYEMKIEDVDATGSIVLLFLYLDPERNLVSWPEGFAGNPTYTELARGYLPEHMELDASAWMTLSLIVED